MESGRLFFAATAVIVLGCYVFTRLRRPPPDRQANETVNCTQHHTHDNSNIGATSSSNSIVAENMKLTSTQKSVDEDKSTQVVLAPARKTNSLSSPCEDQTLETPIDFPISNGTSSNTEENTNVTGYNALKIISDTGNFDHRTSAPKNLVVAAKTNNIETTSQQSVSKDVTLEIVEAKECKHQQELTPECKKNDENFQTWDQIKVTVLDVANSKGTLPSAKERTSNGVYDAEDGELPNSLILEERNSAPQLGIPVQEVPKIRDAYSLPSKGKFRRAPATERSQGKQKYANWKPKGVVPGFKPYTPKKLIASKNIGSSRKKVPAPIKLRRKYQSRKYSKQAAEEPRKSDWRPYTSVGNLSP